MGDMIDLYKDLKAHRKAERADKWESRANDLAALEAAGFTATLMSETSRHYRIHVPGDGWFDFWPSTGRWSQSERPGGHYGKRGHGVEKLIQTLKSTSNPK